MYLIWIISIFSRRSFMDLYIRFPLFDYDWRKSWIRVIMQWNVSTWSSPRAIHCWEIGTKTILCSMEMMMIISSITLPITIYNTFLPVFHLQWEVEKLKVIQLKYNIRTTINNAHLMYLIMLLQQYLYNSISKSSDHWAYQRSNKHSFLVKFFHWGQYYSEW